MEDSRVILGLSMAPVDMYGLENLHTLTGTVTDVLASLQAVLQTSLQVY